MRILVPAPEIPDSFTHNIAYTLRKMGHEVVTCSRANIPSGNSEIVNRALRLAASVSKPWCIYVEKSVLKIANEFKPDLVLVTTATLEPETIHGLKVITESPIVCWYGDSITNIKRNHLFSGEYDHVFLKDKEFVSKANKLLSIECSHLDEACNPDWHRPAKEMTGSHIVVAGTLYSYRINILKSLQAKNIEIKLYGGRPPAWTDKEIQKKYTGIYLDDKNKARAFSSGLACLNTFSQNETSDSLNCRIFETCGCGALLLTERRDSISRCFEPKKEFLDFDSLDECVEQIKRIQKDVKLMSTIRESATKRAHSEHTYQHRLTEIFKRLELQE